MWDNYKNPTQDDLHTTNKKAFQLPDRVTAKRFNFKLLYGGTAPGFAKDPLFNHVSKSIKFWDRVIEKFYTKYAGIREWHIGLARTVLETGELVMPTGRVHSFPRADVARREWYWLPKIKNYPVQGLGADLVAIGRVALWKRLKTAEIPVLFQSTVHDSIDIDCEMVYNNRVVEIAKQSILDIPKNFQRLFGVEFPLPITSETSIGPTLADQRKI